MDRENKPRAATRRRTLQALAAAIGLPGAAWALGGKKPAPQRYNVLWLMSDEHNPFVAGYAGDSRVMTPAIDSIASSGVQFTAAYTPDPICVPARQAFHSGRMASNINHATPNYETLGRYFARMGFRTAWFGKQHWEDVKEKFKEQGLDCESVVKQRFRDQQLDYPTQGRYVSEASASYWGTDLNPDTVCAEQALAYLDTVGNKQFFLGVSLVKPHFPYTIQQAYLDPYLNPPLPKPIVTEAMLADLSTAMKNDRAKYHIAELTPEQDDFGRSVYYGMVSYMDAQVAKVLAKLETLNLRRKTIVVYIADHGELMGQHGIWYKNAFFEGSARVPMLISLPRAFGLPSGTTIAAPVNLIDLYPTLCELLGLVPPPTLEGHSLVPLMNGSDSGSTRVAFSENKRGNIAARMIRTTEFKYCYYADGIEQLYDMRGADRDIEGTNLAADPNYAAIKADLKQRALDGWNPDGLHDDDG